MLGSTLIMPSWLWGRHPCGAACGKLGKWAQSQGRPVCPPSLLLGLHLRLFFPGDLTLSSQPRASSPPGASCGADHRACTLVVLRDAGYTVGTQYMSNEGESRHRDPGDAARSRAAFWPVGIGLVSFPSLLWPNPEPKATAIPFSRVTAPKTLKSSLAPFKEHLEGCCEAGAGERGGVTVSVLDPGQRYKLAQGQEEGRVPHLNAVCYEGPTGELRGAWEPVWTLEHGSTALEREVLLESSSSLPGRAAAALQTSGVRNPHASLRALAGLGEE